MRGIKIGDFLHVVRHFVKAPWVICIGLEELLCVKISSRSFAPEPSIFNYEFSEILRAVPNSEHYLLLFHALVGSAKVGADVADWAFAV